ncbi:cationic amino acid transporter 2, vacuolar-like [Salvia splendens]|uniref:cationic amino acid transporter 2, vacuolar-like n=1 Tax=Salvia splendens TaxID=180675 RepID=UPI001C275930|nr:cationic amino acid transporter 2, vacuolar-like [Salvia splendens]
MGKEIMGGSAATNSAAVLFILALIFAASGAADVEAIAGSNVENCQVINATPGVLVDSVPSKDIVRCARVNVSGLSRLKLGSYSSAHRITLVPSDSIHEKSHKKIQICLHRNASLGLCQCENGYWDGIHGGIWSTTLSPYEDGFIDVKFVDNLFGSVTVSTKLEFHSWRLICLAIGFVLLLLAPIVSSWVPFYYSSSMAIGVCLVVIIVLFQGMKLLPTGRKSALYSTICGLALGAGSFLLNRLSIFVNSVLVNFGINQEMRNPVLVFLLVGVVLSGAAFGYWLVRKFVVADDGSVDVGVAQFVKWALRVVAVTFIFQSTLDIPMAMGLLMLLSGLYFSLTSFNWLGFSDSTFSPDLSPPRRRGVRVSKTKRAEFFIRSETTTPRGSLRKSYKGSPTYTNSPLLGVATPSSSVDYYSTFHRTANKKKYSQEEWKDFTERSTYQAVAELASSPQFTDWVVKDADRIQLQSTERSFNESVGSGSDSNEDNVAASSSGRSGLSWRRPCWEFCFSLFVGMGFPSDVQNNGGGGGSLNTLVRRKQVDSKHVSSSGSRQNQLARALTAPHLIAIGVGATIGSGVYILVGTVAREHSGPALTLSFLIAGIAAGLSAFCYAELASRCPSAGSAYHYSYICIGEVVAWLIGWALMLEYTIGGSAVARGISPNLALLFGGPDSLPSFLARQTIPGFDIVVDPCAAIIVVLVTALLCLGIKESALAQGIVTSVNVCALVFIIVAGGYLGFKTGWHGYELPAGYFPFGAKGMLAGASTVFFAYTGFDSITSTAEEVKNPQKDLPIGIGSALSICCTLYMLVSAVIVGLVPYYAMDPDTPISSAFASHGMQWAAYIITIGSCTALCASLTGSLLPQPRILMAMARDGLLPSFFSDINRSTQVPIKSTIVTGFLATILAFVMDVEQLSGMVSLGTLLAYTTVAICVLILRYVPPDEVPFPLSYKEAIDSVSSRRAISNSPADICVEHPKVYSLNTPFLVRKETTSIRCPSINRGWNFLVNKRNRRNTAGWAIMITCIGILIFTCATSFSSLSSILRTTFCGIGLLLLLSGLIMLTFIDQDVARHSFGQEGGFICPFVPLLPVTCILINMYLLVNLSAATWTLVSIWLALALLVYVCYSCRRSPLKHAYYVPAAHVDEIYEASAQAGHNLNVH